MIDYRAWTRKPKWYPVAKQPINQNQFPELKENNPKPKNYPSLPIHPVQAPSPPPFLTPTGGWRSIVLDTPDIWKKEEHPFVKWGNYVPPDEKVVKEIIEKQTQLEKVVENIKLYMYELSLLEQRQIDVSELKYRIQDSFDKSEKAENFYKCMLKYYEPEYQIEIYPGRFIQMGRAGKKEMVLTDLKNFSFRFLPGTLIKKIARYRNFYFTKLTMEQKMDMVKTIYECATHETIEEDEN